jgi:hypothetical protein
MLHEATLALLALAAVGLVAAVPGADFGVAEAITDGGQGRGDTGRERGGGGPARA